RRAVEREVDPRQLHPALGHEGVLQRALVRQVHAHCLQHAIASLHLEEQRMRTVREHPELEVPRRWAVSALELATRVKGRHLYTLAVQENRERLGERHPLERPPILNDLLARP